MKILIVFFAMEKVQREIVIIQVINEWLNILKDERFLLINEVGID
jgi:hypothetical protein